MSFRDRAEGTVQTGMKKNTPAEAGVFLNVKEGYCVVV